MIVLIPAYEPGQALPRLVAELRREHPLADVIIVDDGSGATYASVFDETRRAGATVLTHPANRGKGVALRTGIAHAVRAHPGAAVVTADADGQHTVADIGRVAHETGDAQRSGIPTLILGCRAFTGDVPLRSRAGNAVARGIFRLAAGWSLGDTQTGLRGIPADLLPWVAAQPGDRFEFEQNVLLRSRQAGVAVREVPIETVYLDHNASSHFRPLVDSVRVMLPLLLFAGSSLLGFLVDTVALLVLSALTGLLVPSIIAARVLSASVNFAVNRRLVFGRRGGSALPRQLGRYAVLAVALLATNIVWIEALTRIGTPLLAAKVVTEAVLFVIGFGVQRAFVFGRAASASASADDAGEAAPAVSSGTSRVHTELGSSTGARHRNPIGPAGRMERDTPTTRRTR